MERLRIGISPCPNDVWVFAGLLRGSVAPGADAIFEDVQTLNERAEACCDLDLVKISYAAWPKWTRTHHLLRCGGALGRGCGPLLLRNGEGFDPEQPIWIPGRGTTAAFLLRDWLGHPPLDAPAAPFDALYRHLVATPGAQGVVIHEKRFTYARDGLSLIADLGEAWEARTGCPIPLGAIVAPKEKDAVRLEEMIRESLAWADAHPVEALDLCREYADDMDESVMRSHIGLYVNPWTWDLGDVGQRAVETFLSRLRAQG